MFPSGPSREMAKTKQTPRKQTGGSARRKGPNPKPKRVRTRREGDHPDTLQVRLGTRNGRWARQPGRRGGEKTQSLPVEPTGIQGCPVPEHRYQSPVRDQAFPEANGAAYQKAAIPESGTGNHLRCGPICSWRGGVQVAVVGP